MIYLPYIYKYFSFFLSFLFFILFCHILCFYCLSSFIHFLSTFIFFLLSLSFHFHLLFAFTFFLLSLPFLRRSSFAETGSCRMRLSTAAGKMASLHILTRHWSLLSRQMVRLSPWSRFTAGVSQSALTKQLLWPFLLLNTESLTQISYRFILSTSCLWHIQTFE